MTGPETAEANTQPLQPQEPEQEQIVGRHTAAEATAQNYEERTPGRCR